MSEPTAAQLAKELRARYAAMQASRVPRSDSDAHEDFVRWCKTNALPIAKMLDAAEERERELVAVLCDVHKAVAKEWDFQTERGSPIHSTLEQADNRVCALLAAHDAEPKGDENE